MTMVEQQLSISGARYRAMTQVNDPEDQRRADSVVSPIQSISALTLATHDMARAVRFYRALGFAVHYGGEDASFTSFAVGSSFLNIVTASPESRWRWWGRAIFHVADVDAVYARAVRAGLEPEAPPRDATWGERFFHLIDPDGHELSFARPLDAPPSAS
jgi:catechol 2,3-dioxygenase-like lactoylglutathione lyase family enzyme